MRFLLRFLQILFDRFVRRRGLPPPTPAPTPRGGDALEIDYAPSRDGNADPGEIVWTWVPFEEDPQQGKDRPVLVVGSRRGRLVGVALTSKPHREHLEIGAGAWDHERRASYVKIDRLLDLDRPIRREGAVLDRARFDRVARALRAAQTER